MSALMVASRQRVSHGMRDASGAAFTLAAAVLGFFMITLDAVVVNVALPSIRAGLGGGITGLQWVVDGYTLMFAALLLSAGSLSRPDRRAARVRRRAGGVRRRLGRVRAGTRHRRPGRPPGSCRARRPR